MFYSEETLGLPHVLKEDIQVICGFKNFIILNTNDNTLAPKQTWNGGHLGFIH